MTPPPLSEMVEYPDDLVAQLLAADELPPVACFGDVESMLNWLDLDE